MKIEAKIWNTLLICIAQKTDVRRYLRGINFDPVNNRISSTDGHRLFVQNNVNFEAGNDAVTVLLDNSYKAQSGIEYVEINEFAFNPNERFQIDYYNKSDEIVLSRYTDLDSSRFPDIDRVLPTEDDIEAVDFVAINPEYIADVSKSLKAKAMKLNIHKGNKYSMDFVPYKDIQYVVMAIRL